MNHGWEPLHIYANYQLTKGFSCENQLNVETFPWCSIARFDHQRVYPKIRDSNGTNPAFRSINVHEQLRWVPRSHDQVGGWSSIPAEIPLEWWLPRHMGIQQRPWHTWHNFMMFYDNLRFTAMQMMSDLEVSCSPCTISPRKWWCDVSACRCKQLWSANSRYQAHSGCLWKCGTPKICILLESICNLIHMRTNMYKSWDFGGTIFRQSHFPTGPSDHLGGD